MKFAHQPKIPGTLYGPRGVVGAISYPVLRDVVLPQFWEMVEGTDLVAEWRASEMKATLNNGAEILFRSLDDPNKLRGIEISWFFVDEGRHITRLAWDVLVGRLRQKGYSHAGWVCSTSNGFDWMWSLFNSKSKIHMPQSRWFTASTMDNREHVGDDYIESLEATYVKDSPLYRQEVLGEFVGVLKGQVFSEYDRLKHAVPLEYDPELPLGTGWDFGVGDEGVCLWLQTKWTEEKLTSGKTVMLPWVYVIDRIRASDWNADEWAEAFHEKRYERFDGRLPGHNWGDPAGMQRTIVTATSIIDALRSRGVPVNPAKKQPPENGIQLLRPIMAADRFFVDGERCEDVSQALSSHKWKVDDLGNRIGSAPVHDTTSHTAAALGYFATSELSHYARYRAPAKAEPPAPNTMQHIVNQLIKPKPGNWLGQRSTKQVEWSPTRIGG